MNKEDTQPKVTTDYLGDVSVSLPEPRRVTGPLDHILPWVILFRIVGTANTIEVRVTDRMVLGRRDDRHKVRPNIDFTDFGGRVLGVSREHAVIKADGEHLMLRDLNSTNGTHLNGHRLQSGQDYWLRDGDKVTLGRLEIQVVFAVIPTSDERTRNLPLDETPVISMGRKVLLLEDSENMANVFASALRYAGYKTYHAATSGDAIQYLDDKRPDVIVVEAMLGDMKAEDFLRYVRRHDEMASIPIVVVSSGVGDFQMHQAMGAGANAFMSIPISLDRLVHAVTQLTSSTAR
ncbi:MAG: FHA domain-containing protein [Chloroflexi bacterium]|nr:MAG: hypothetical protein CUN54_08105 [Phototrophicales bacterium]RMF77525.1 MAG: FHA domain-containing protein [Chloroflexota bacterium]